MSTRRSRLSMRRKPSSGIDHQQEQSLWLDIGSTHQALGHLRRY
jgi:hypothetical protein